MAFIVGRSVVGLMVEASEKRQIIHNLFAPASFIEHFVLIFHQTVLSNRKIGCDSRLALDFGFNSTNEVTLQNIAYAKKELILRKSSKKLSKAFCHVIIKPDFYNKL